MNATQWMVINKNGIQKIRQSKPDLGWNEIAVRVSVEVPDELFKRPHIEASIKVSDVPNTAYDADIVVNTKELIEQQTGAKIDFKIVHDDPEATS